MPDDPDARALMRWRQTHPGFEPTDPPPAMPPPPRAPHVPSDPPPEETPSFVVRAARTPLARLLVLIAAACTGLAGVVTATGAAVSNVIATVAEAKARRTNWEIDNRLDAVEVRVNGRFGLDLEEKARIAADGVLGERIEQVRAECLTPPKKSKR